jgi:hypothetical protein
MRYLILSSLSFILSSAAIAQPGTLLPCDDMEDKIGIIKTKFDTFFDEFKDSKISEDEYSKEYTSTFDLCGVKPTLRETKYEYKYTFRYRGTDVKGSKEDFLAFWESLQKAFNKAFNDTHFWKLVPDAGDGYQSYRFYENGKDGVSSKRTMVIQVSTGDHNSATIFLSVKRNR